MQFPLFLLQSYPEGLQTAFSLTSSWINSVIHTGEVLELFFLDLNLKITTSLIPLLSREQVKVHGPFGWLLCA